MSEPKLKGSVDGRCLTKEPECRDESIEIDFDLIPDHVREDLAAATLESVREFLRKPGGREFLEKKKRERKRRLNIDPDS